MIAHALTIVKNELDRHLTSFDGNPGHAVLGSVSDVATQGAGDSRNRVVLSLVNLQEERTLKNLPAYVRDDTTLRVRYENPPAYVNLAILVAATHGTYENALLELSRALLFFQAHNVFTPDNVAPESLNPAWPVNDLDRLIDFKLILNLWSPTLEEVNDMWGMLGGKQYPFALYSVRMLELKLAAVRSEAGVITELVHTFAVKPAVT